MVASGTPSQLFSSERKLVRSPMQLSGKATSAKTLKIYEYQQQVYTITTETHITHTAFHLTIIHSVIPLFPSLYVTCLVKMYPISHIKLFAFFYAIQCLCATSKYFHCTTFNDMEELTKTLDY